MGKRPRWVGVEVLFWVAGLIALTLAVTVPRSVEPERAVIVEPLDMISINDCASYCARRLMEKCDGEPQYIVWRE